MIIIQLSLIIKSLSVMKLMRAGGENFIFVAKIFT